MSLCLRRSRTVTLSLYSTCCYLLISGVSRMHSPLCCVLSPLPHALQDEESRNRRASETARARFLVCGTPWHFAIFLTLWLTQTSRIYGREYTVWAIGTVPHRRTARFLFTSAFTRYLLRDRPRLHFTCSIVSYSSPPLLLLPPLYPPYRLVSDKHPIDRKWRDGLREST